MRKLIVVVAFLGLAVSGCAESQPAFVPAVEPVEIEMSDDSASETDLYFVESTTADGSREVRYHVEILIPQLRSFVNGNGQEIVRTELVPITEERIAIVPHDEDVAEFLRLSAGGKIVPYEAAAAVIADVEPAPVPPVPPVPPAPSID